jgi:hypothetical protein
MSDGELDDEMGPFSRLRVSGVSECGSGGSGSHKKNKENNMNTFENLFVNLNVSDVREGGGDKDMGKGKRGKMGVGVGEGGEEEVEISLDFLESLLFNMKAKNQNSIKISVLLNELNLKQEKVKEKENVLHASGVKQSPSFQFKWATNSHEKDNDKKEKSPKSTVENNHSDSSRDKDVIVEDESGDDSDDGDDDESISSSLNSSWAESPSHDQAPIPKFSFQPSPVNKPPTSSNLKEPSPPISFDFKTPKKIFNTKKVVAEKQVEVDGVPNPENATGFVVDSSPPPNFFDPTVSAATSGSVFGPSDDDLLPSKKSTNGIPPPPVARTLFGTDTSGQNSTQQTQPTGNPILSSSLFGGDGAPNVTFDMGISKTNARGNKKKGVNKARAGKAQMSQNLPTTNFHAFKTSQSPQQFQEPQTSSTSEGSSTLPFTFPPPPPHDQNFPCPSPMDMDMSPNDRIYGSDSQGKSSQEPISFSFNMGSGKAKSGIKGSTKKNRRNVPGSSKKKSPGSSNASDANNADGNQGFYTSPIKNQSFSKPQTDTSEEMPEPADREEVDERMIALAELFKKEGKQLYSMERYDM